MHSYMNVSLVFMRRVSYYSYCHYIRLFKIIGSHENRYVIVNT